MTSCVYNPVAACDPGTYGYQCQGANRPESYNPEIKCGQGVRDANKNLIETYQSDYYRATANTATNPVAPVPPAR